jgi:hypothetical protein
MFIEPENGENWGNLGGIKKHPTGGCGVFFV